jgi:hypothetical protein
LRLNKKKNNNTDWDFPSGVLEAFFFVLVGGVFFFSILIPTHISESGLVFVPPPQVNGLAGWLAWWGLFAIDNYHLIVCCYSWTRWRRLWDLTQVRRLAGERVLVYDWI